MSSDVIRAFNLGLSSTITFTIDYYANYLVNNRLVYETQKSQIAF